ncbi:hypothetical protein [Limnobaculum xujianqingii]|nr:hypothetical protein [Limnobaculum xujianqingii]
MTDTELNGYLDALAIVKGRKRSRGGQGTKTTRKRVVSKRKKRG